MKILKVEIKVRETETVEIEVQNSDSADEIMDAVTHKLEEEGKTPDSVEVEYIQEIFI